jgi:hypothetical protein
MENKVEEKKEEVKEEKKEIKPQHKELKPEKRFIFDPDESDYDLYFSVCNEDDFKVIVNQLRVLIHTDYFEDMIECCEQDDAKYYSYLISGSDLHVDDSIFYRQDELRTVFFSAGYKEDSI